MLAGLPLLGVFQLYLPRQSSALSPQPCIFLFLLPLTVNGTWASISDPSLGSSKWPPGSVSSTFQVTQCILLSPSPQP